MNISCVSALSVIPKSKNSELMEILQKRRNADIRECDCKKSCNANQMILNSKLFSNINNHVACIWVLGASESSRLIKSSPFSFISALTLHRLN